MNLNKTLMISRSILALSTLLTLVFNNTEHLFPKYHLDRLKYESYDFINYNIFIILDNNLILCKIICITILSLVILGIYPRILSILHFYISYSFFHSTLVQEGGDQINLILCLLIIPLCFFNNRILGWKYEYKNLKKYQEQIIKATLFIVQIQMSYLYFEATILKIPVEDWSNGTAVYYWFNSNVFGFNNTMKAIFDSITNIYTISFITWSVILLEFFLCISIFLEQKYKYIAFRLGFIFHFMIIIIHGLPTFSFTIIAGLIMYLFDFNKSFNQNIQEILCKKKKLPKAKNTPKPLMS